jgi:RNA binding exosome subunit
LTGPIKSLEVSYFVHATEDGDKIAAAVSGIFGPLGEPRAEEMEGHFGNKIVRVSHHLNGEDAAMALTTVLSNMSLDLKRRLREELGVHLDEHSAFYLRLDKQRLLAGRLQLTDSDPVRVRVKPRSHTVKSGACSFFAGLLS